MPIFRERLERLRRLVRQQEMAILVWGPGDPGASEAERKPFAKRQQIKHQLAEVLDRSEVHFSEDPEMVALTAGVLGQLEKEEVQASLADCILILAISRGATLELDHLVPTFAWAREKVYVLLPEAYLTAPSLARSAVLSRLEPEHVIGYSPQEFEDCSLVTRKVVEIADTMAMRRYLRQHGGF